MHPEPALILQTKFLDAFYVVNANCHIWFKFHWQVKSINDMKYSKLLKFDIPEKYRNSIYSKDWYIQQKYLELTA